MTTLLTCGLFTLMVATTWAIAWRLASTLLPKATTSVFLLGFALLLQAVPSLFVVWTGLVGAFDRLVALPLLLLAWFAARRLLPRWRSCGELFGHLAFARGYAVVTAAIAWLGLFAFAIVALNQLRYTAIDADSMWYHLVMPAEWVRTGSIWPADAVPMMAKGYPGFRQSFVAWLSLPAGDEHLALPGLLEFPLLALATYALARQFDAGRALAMAVGLAAATTPVALAGLSTQGNDLALAIYLCAAVVFCMRFLRDGARGDAWLAGVALAALMASKFSGPGYCFVVLLVCVAQCGARRLLSRRNLLALAAGPLLLAAPWYARNLVTWGNPLWPARLEVARVVFDGPLGRGFFAKQTMGFDLEPLLANLGFFVDAHGWLAPIVAFGFAVVGVAALLGRRRLRASIAPIALPVLLFVLWLQHPFNLPRFDANYSHRYLIAWCAVSFASLAAGLWALLPNVWVGALFGLSAVAGLAGVSSLVWPALALAVALAFVPARAMVQDVCHGMWRVMCELRVPTWLTLAALLLVAAFVSLARGELQYSSAVGYRDGSSEKGWAACVGYVHREVSGARVGLHGSHFLFPLIGEPWSNEVVIADEPLLERPRRTPAEVLEWIGVERLDYVVCCRDRERGPGGEWEFADSLADYLRANAPGRFEVVFEHQGAHVLRVRPE